MSTKVMYQKIVKEIKQQIEVGELRSHDPIPSQSTLAARYQTSEITSRRALMELVNEGLIYRIRGKGSFVRDKRSESTEVGANKFSVEAPKVKINKVYFILPLAHAASMPFFLDQITSMHQMAAQHGIEFHVLDHNYPLPDDPEAGIICGTNWAADKMEEFLNHHKRRIPIVTTHFYYPHLNIPYVIVDNITGGYLATQHLLSLGHKRIGIVLTHDAKIGLNQEFSLRLQGYKLALNLNKIEFDPDLVSAVHGVMETSEMGKEGFRYLMELPEPPTAVFMTADMKAIGAYEAAQEMGIRIPEDISMIGYDNLFVGQFMIPPLTTVSQNSHLMGKRAMEMLLFETAQDRLVKEEIVPNLVIRGSTEKRKKD